MEQVTTHSPGMPAWWATRAVFAVSALCAIAGILIWSTLSHGRAEVTRVLREAAVAAVGGPAAEELDRADALFASDMSYRLVIQGMALLLILAGVGWYFYVRHQLVRHLGDTGKAAMRHKTVVAWRIAAALAVTVSIGVPATQLGPGESAAEHAVREAYVALDAMAFVQVLLAVVTIAAVRVISQRTRFLFE